MAISNRGFAQNRELARRAGRIGGQNSHAGGFKDRKLASEAGKKGGSK